MTRDLGLLKVDIDVIAARQDYTALLKQEEIALMWNTAPPRMPFPPHGSSSDQPEPKAAENGE